MISLLLTLFISLFSFGPSNYRVMDHQENNIVDVDYSLQKNIVDSNNNYLFTLTDFMSTHFLSQLILDNQIAYGTIEHSIEWYNIDFYMSNWNNTKVVSTGNGGSYFAFNDNSQAKHLGHVVLNYLGRNTVNNIMYFSYSLNFYTLNEHQALVYNVLIFPGYRDTLNNNSDVWFSQDWGSADVPTGIYITTQAEYLDEYVFLMSDNPLYFNNQRFISWLSGSDNYDLGYETGYQIGNQDGIASGYQNGYADGLAEADSYDSTASTIFEGIFDVGLLPVNVFLTIFNFELFGVNIAGIVSGLLTLSVVIIIVRMLLGGKKDD